MATMTPKYSVSTDSSKVLPLLSVSNCKTVRELLGNMKLNNFLMVETIPKHLINTILNEALLLHKLIKAILHDLHVPFEWPEVYVTTSHNCFTIYNIAFANIYHYFYISDFKQHKHGGIG